jgi:uncharacterized membrane protein YhhN
MDTERQYSHSFCIVLTQLLSGVASLVLPICMYVCIYAVPTTVAVQSSFQEVMMLGRICWLRWCHGESYVQIHNFQV